MGKGPGKSYGCHSGGESTVAGHKEKQLCLMGKGGDGRNKFVSSKGSHRADRAGYGWRGQRSRQGGHGGLSVCDVIEVAQNHLQGWRQAQ